MPELFLRGINGGSSVEGLGGISLGLPEKICGKLWEIPEGIFVTYLEGILEKTLEYLKERITVKSFLKDSWTNCERCCVVMFQS